MNEDLGNFKLLDHTVPALSLALYFEIIIDSHAFFVNSTEWVNRSGPSL